MKNSQSEHPIMDGSRQREKTHRANIQTRIVFGGKESQSEHLTMDGSRQRGHLCAILPPWMVLKDRTFNHGLFPAGETKHTLNTEP